MFSFPGKFKVSRCGLLTALLAIASISISHICNAGPRNARPDDAFYHQLLKLPEAGGYQPTRSFTIITDAEHGNQLVAEDDPNLRFNLMWMEQFRPGYKSREGGSAFGEIFRSYVKSAYKAYRDRNAQSMAAMPDEEGSLHAKRGATNFIDAMDYNLKLTESEVRFKIEYNY
jgi:hypothetical protein